MKCAGKGVAAVAAVLMCALLAPALAAAASKVKTELKINVLSNRADLISGGDALVQIAVPSGVDPNTIQVDVGGQDVTSAFAVRADGRFLGRVENLALGANVLSARLPNRHGSRITITNHAGGGPVFSGPQILPWTCFAGSFDPQCDRPVVYEFFYQPSAGGGFQSYDPENPPADVATTTTDQGNTVPYIVRQETGSVDRDEYRIAVLYDPTKPFEPWAPQPGFNHKLVITHGASCNTEYQQASAPDVLNETALSRGFAVMSHALNNSGHNCNVVLQAEAMLMAKERVIERYGELRYTIGSGCSEARLPSTTSRTPTPASIRGSRRPAPSRTPGRAGCSTRTTRCFAGTSRTRQRGSRALPGQRSTCRP